MRLILLIPIMLVSLVGCMMGPNYKRPCVAVPYSYRYEPKVVARTADTKWWKQFNDPVLNELIAKALANNWNVKIATANMEQAVGILMTTRSTLFPQLNYNIAANRNRFSENQALPGPNPNPFNNFQILAGAAWEIDIWGRIRRLSESAQANVFANKEIQRGVILSLVAEVGATYIQLRALDEQLVISKRTLKTYGKSLRYFKLQHKYGQVAGLTVEQARSQYETAAAKIPEIQLRIAQTENALSILLGCNPGPIIRGRKLNKLTMPPVPESLPSQLLKRRPDILQAEQTLIAANAQIGAAKALYFPTFSLTGQYGLSSNVLSKLLSGPSSSWNYGGSLLGPIFTAGGIQGQVVQATAATRAAAFNYRQTIQRAFADVENTLVARDKLQKQYVAESNRVRAYKKYKTLAWHRYNGGYSPYLEVLFAESQLYPAELNAVQTKAATLISVINIYKAIGGGWVDQADRMTCDIDPRCRR